MAREATGNHDGRGVLVPYCNCNQDGPVEKAYQALSKRQEAFFGETLTADPRTMPQRESAPDNNIFTQLETMNVVEIDNLRSAIFRLVDKLGPVLTPNPSDASANALDTPPLSPIHAHVFQMRCQLDGLRNVVFELLRNVDLP